MNIITSAFFTDQDLVTLISLKMVNLSIEHGNSDSSTYGYAMWGILAGSRLADYKVGYEFGQLAMKLTEQFNSANLACKIFNLFGAQISPWRSHLKKSIQILRSGYLAGVETGDVHSSYNSYNLILQRIVVADNLSSILEESNRHLDFLRPLKNQMFMGAQQVYRHFIFNLQGLTLDKFSLSSDEFDEVQCLLMWQENNFLTGVAPHNIFKTQILFLYGNYEKALSLARESQNSLAFISGVPIQADHYLHYSLILIALYPTVSQDEQKEYWSTLETN
jgi:predicted ATPase